MSTRTLMWTALPNGVTPDGQALRLSVLVSPRLVTDDGGDGKLGQFPDLGDWPAVVAALTFSIEVDGGPTIPAAPVVEAGYPAPDSAAWQAMFPPETLVHSYTYEDLDGRIVRSFPVQEVHAFVRQQYTAVAVRSPELKPGLGQLGFDVRSQGPRIADLAQLALDGDGEAEVAHRIDTVLEREHAFPPGVGTPVMSLYQARVMHQPPAPPRRDGTGQLVAQTLPDVDFHKAVGAMGQYPKLLRALGLAIDLRIPLDAMAAATTGGNIRVTPHLNGAAPITPWTAFVLDRAAAGFTAAPGPDADVANAMIDFSGPDRYDVVEVDVDGAAEKVLDFATNLARVAYGNNTTIDTPDRYGLPALRSAGFSAARSGRAVRLVDTFARMKQHNDHVTADPRSPQVVLHADDITRGYRIDVWDSASGEWHSLSQRDGRYVFQRGTPKALSRSYSDEGFATLATTDRADGSGGDLRLPESLFRWAGWSLCVRRAGRTIGSDSNPNDPSNAATTDFHLETSFTVTKGSLPRLRFGTQYQFRARAVDLAGNSLPPDDVIDEAYSIPPQPLSYLRHEPVVAPVVVLRDPLGPDTTPGESLDRLVIRSNFDTHIAGLSQRHIAPPKTSEEMAEAHGMLDGASGAPDKAAYALLAGRDGSFEVNPTGADRAAPVPHPEAQLALPYLPDPMCPGAAFFSLPRTAPGMVWKTPWSGGWPDTRPFRLALDEGSGPPSFVETAAEVVLTVHLPKAEVVDVALSSFLTDDSSTTPPRQLSTMAIWDWIVQAAPPTLSQLRQLALDGRHWMLTPARTLTLVHAVQQPLIEPQFQHLTAARDLGSTSAVLTDELPISGKSTDKIDVEARWTEPVDDGTDATQPVPLSGAARAFERTLEVGDTVAVLDGIHEFHDTKHRTVSYTAVAATRFREYFPAAITADRAKITRTSVPEVVSVPSSARPPAPRVLYVLPTFAWTDRTEGAWNLSRRGGGGLRVYLDRPWYSSGEGELLGVVLWACEPPQHDQFDGYSVPDYLRSYVTQWGLDPIWSAAPPPSQAAPRPTHFRNAVAVAQGLSLDELRERPATPVSVAGHKVEWDPDRRLWFCDIDLDQGDAYFPFVRLALARFQPDSVPDAHLSRVVLAEFVQLVPDRSASITLDPIDLTELLLAVTGPVYDAPGAATMLVTVQTQAPGGAWVSKHTTALVASAPVGPDTLWSGQITLPAPRGSRPFRLLIEEFETFTTDGQTSQRRLVYADVIDL